MKEKIKVKKLITNLRYELDGPIEDVIKTLKYYKKEYPNCTCVFEEYGYAYDPTNHWALRLFAEVLETDEEFQKRIEKEKIMEERNKKWRQQQYENLKKEFGEK